MLRKKTDLNRYIDILLFVFLMFYPLFSTAFHVEIMGKYIAFILFALSLDLLWGYTGMLSMGHAVMFGLGAYIGALSSAFQNGVPDFMKKAGLTEIPVWMQPLQNPTVAIILGIAIPALLAAIIGCFLFSSKVNGVFFTLITLALSNIFYTLFNNQQKYVGGYNGINKITRPEFLGEKMSLHQYYIFAVVLLLAVYVFCRVVTRSRIGKMMCAIRDNESRCQALGYKTSNYKIFVYALSGALAGMAGLLYGPFNSSVSPSDLGPAISTMVIIWVAIGGIGTLTGAMFGTLLINLCESWFSVWITDYWKLILGIVIVVCVIYLPNGFTGKLQQWEYERTRKGGKLV